MDHKQAKRMSYAIIGAALRAEFRALASEVMDESPPDSREGEDYAETMMRRSRERLADLLKSQSVKDAIESEIELADVLTREALVGQIDKLISQLERRGRRGQED